MLLAAGVDGDNSFFSIMVAVWGLFWIAVTLWAKIRVSPTKTGLVAMRDGPLMLLILVFAVGQYL
jgi:hypothetical protein